MVIARLTVSFDRHTVVPILKRVRSNRAGDVLTVRMVTGQIPDDFAHVSERLCHTFGARTCRVAPGPRPDLVVRGCIGRVRLLVAENEGQPCFRSRRVELAGGRMRPKRRRFDQPRLCRHEAKQRQQDQREPKSVLAHSPPARAVIF